MSLIEQAARRLAELQRAGAQVPDTATGLGPEAAAGTAARVPTPEPIVRDFGTPIVGGVQTSEAALSTPSRPGPAPAGLEPTFTPRHKVEIDHRRLAQLGLVTPDDLNSWMAHELRVLKRPILRNVKGQSGKPIPNANRVMVTSALPGEGKTFTAVSLALSMAMEFDDAVLLVDGDVAHPSLLQMLGVEQSSGLLDMLAADVPLEETVLQTNVDRLLLLPAGSRHRRATELIASDRMDQLMDTLAARLPGHIIVFDSPPLLPTTESRVLATHVGQVVMVVAADSTTRQAVAEALATIERCECVMMLLNKAVASRSGSYYGYGYYGDEAPRS
jgi:exopolysaccharide/PEP-CTERM locus tyrosine autokinase